MRRAAAALCLGLAITLAGMRVYVRKYKVARPKPVAEEPPRPPPCPPKPLR